MTRPLSAVAPPIDRRSHARLPGPDVVRAVALIGVVVMNFHGYLLLRGGSRGTGGIDDFFDPWNGPLSTRFAATFVLVAGVGVTLLTCRSIGDAGAVRRKRWTLVRRGLVLYLGGLLLDIVWRGTILPFYGAMFVLAAAMFTLRSRWVLTIGAVAALTAAGLHWLRTQQHLDDERPSSLLEPSGGALKVLTDVFINGTHPLLPWLAFFCTGIALGRVLDARWWRPVAVVGGLALFAGASLVSVAVPAGPLATELGSTDPFSRGVLYVASALGTALVAFGVVTWLADRFTTTPPIELLRNAGAITLTLYVAHALVFNLVVDWLGWVRPTGLDTALVFSAVYWAVAIAVAAWYHRRFGVGPVERVYRVLGGR